MQKITNSEELKNSILQLEYRQADEWIALRGQFLITYENLKPLTLIKNTFREVTSSPDFKDDLLGAAVGLTSGYLSKVLITGLSNQPVKKILGSILQLGVSNIVSRHPETIKWLAGNIVNLFKKGNNNTNGSMINNKPERVKKTYAASNGTI